MARLEYRADDESREFPILYYYDPIDPDEVSMRFACDYFVKNRIVYEKSACTVSHRNHYVIYVKPAEDEQVVDSGALPIPRWSGIRMEVREFREGTSIYPVVHTFDFQDDDQALLHLQADLLRLHGRDWRKTSTEIDEDRQVYVFYAQPTA
jgi:hypothetical protein